jgi:O-antigen/teichoic acid export membrane protein
VTTLEQDARRTPAVACETAAETSPPAGPPPLPPDVQEPALRKRALRASAWVLGAKPLGMAIQLGRSMILTRLLFPEAFGLMALVSVVLQGLQMCSDVGIGPNIVQSKRGEEPRFLQTAWTLQIIRGAVLWLLCCLVAWPASLLYGEPALAWMLPVAGLSVLIGGLGSTAFATHDRRMLRGRLTMVSYGEMLVSTGMLIVLALVFRSVWALVIGSLVGTLVRVVFSHVFLPGIRHRFRWDSEAVRELVGFGKWIFISTLLTFFAMQTDKLMLGRLVGTTTLGVYSIALVLTSLPRTLVQQIAGAVLFPALAEKFRDDPRQMYEKVRRARGVLLRVSLLMVLGVVAVAPAFFHYLYDARYHDAGWIAQLLAVSVWTAILSGTSDRVLLALGDSRSMAFANFCNLVVTAGACLAGHYLAGLPGFIVGFAAGTAAGELMIGLRLRSHGIGVLRQDLAYTALGVGAVAVMLAAGHLIGAAGDHGLLVSAGVGVAVVAALAGAMAPNLKRELAGR